ncbi:TIGR03862 family flavoprotein [Maritimibacter alkaliphilus]|uniref:TIGR03862 family flavoprotein n=1 Tax=Maritimibacter alkaliphilus TaxID=404236 RepID=UPI0028F72AB8|nr:TIGR03862 family flavoprotein [Maritimibacter alkaliphilus]
MAEIWVIGAGPAGLMAAEAAAGQGHRVVLAEAMPSPARKFLMAGKSGLNLTKDEPFDRVLAAYGGAAPVLRPMLEAFGPRDVQDWAEGLGQALFTGSTGRVFPKVMKASPLLRAWLARLDGLGVVLHRRWRWTGWGDSPRALRFDTPEGPREVTPDAVVLACGGASWARLGSDGGWAAWVAPVAPFQPANCGFLVDWTEKMAPQFGRPVKAVALRAGDRVSRGEFVISARGIEGGAVYALADRLREGVPLLLDLAPDLGLEEVRARLSRRRRGDSLASHLRKALKFDPAKRALLMECARPLPEDVAAAIKALPLPLVGPRPMDEAISVAGGLRFEGLDAELGVVARPGVFACGEMLDWEAPTGGYLLTACLATGRWAGLAAARACA